MRLWPSIVVLAAIVACGTFGSEPGPTDSAIGDAATEGSTEGGSDAGDPSFCSQHPGVFCDDFETNLDRWFPQSPPVGVVERIASPRPGAPNNFALHVHSDLAKDGAVTAALFKTFPLPVHHIVYSFDIFVVTLAPVDSSTYYETDISELRSASAHSWANLQYTPAGAFEVRAIGEGQQPAVVPGNPPFASGAWHRIRVEATAGLSGNDQLSVGWEVVVTPLLVKTTLSVNEDLSLVIGTTTGGAGTVDMLYDDVLVEVLE